MTTAEIVEDAAGAVHVLGLSVLSGSHLSLVEATLDRLRESGLGHIPVVVGGIIPHADANACSPSVSPASTRPRTLR